MQFDTDLTGGQTLGTDKMKLRELVEGWCPNTRVRTYMYFPNCCIDVSCKNKQKYLPFPLVMTFSSKCRRTEGPACTLYPMVLLLYKCLWIWGLELPFSVNDSFWGYDLVVGYCTCHGHSCNCTAQIHTFYSCSNLPAMKPGCSVLFSVLVFCAFLFPSSFW